MIDTIHSPDALADPYGNKVTITREFLRIPLLADTITDTHFAKRDRLGVCAHREPLTFNRIEENVGVLVELDGTAHVVGDGPAYFLESTEAPEVCAHREPLTFARIGVQRLVAEKSFQIKTWEGQGETYTLSIVKGIVSAPGRSQGVY